MKQKKQSKKPSKPVRAWALKNMFLDGAEYRVFKGWPKWQVLQVAVPFDHDERIVRVEIREV